jgi:hypothetical protein
MSDQLWALDRDPNTCQITGVDATNTGNRAHLLAYLQRLSTLNPRPEIIIRINPSPGNFDTGDPTHTLNIWQFPDVSYCANGVPNPKNRIAQDVADEINAIHAYNQADGIVEAGFEPANEPNQEWYVPDHKADLAGPAPWQQMAAYFIAVDQGAASGVKVFTPPMAQGWYAEGFDLTANGLNTAIKNGTDCPAQQVDDDGVNTTGYDLMSEYYIDWNSGIDWHNYWRSGFETYYACSQGGLHVSSHLPAFIRSLIQQEGGAITEADLFSYGGYPFQDPSEPLQDKDDQPDDAGASIGTFDAWELANMPGVSFIADQLLSVQASTPAPGGTPDPNEEQEWHEAYVDATPVPTGSPTPQYQEAGERQWFSQWYLDGCPDWDPYCEGVCNILDLGTIGVFWQQTGPAGWVRADVGWYGAIDIRDLTTIGQHWQETWQPW